MLARLVALPACVVALALAACGGGGGGSGSGGGAFDPEKQFASLGCASCHALEAAGSTGRIGPDLDELKPDAAAVARQMRTGGGGMPSFEDDLSPTDLDALARWVARAAAGGG